MPEHGYAPVNGLQLYYEIHGSGAALQVAIDHPELVGKPVLASLATSLDGVHPGLLDGIQNLRPEDLAGSPFQQAYARVAPNPDGWPALIEKIKRMDRSLPEWPAETIRSVAAPALLVYGDSDIVRPEHMAELFRLFGGGVVGDNVGLPASRLAILPGTTHITLANRAEWLASMIDEFLDGS